MNSALVFSTHWLATSPHPSNDMAKLVGGAAEMVDRIGAMVQWVLEESGQA